MDFLIDNLALFMILALALLLFSGYPVALVLIGVALGFGLIGYTLDQFPLIALFNIPLRIYSTLAENLIYPAVPMLLFMGIALERSGIGRELLLCLQVLLRRVPASQVVAVTVIGIILAPSAGLVGASVATLAYLALPTMLESGYKASFATGSIAAAGTLGLILPPAIMLFFLADELGVLISQMFLSTIVPGLVLVVLYVAYYIGAALLDPRIAPPLAAVPVRSTLRFALYVARSLALPVLLIAMVLGSVIAGLATPTQSACVGAAGAILLMLLNRSLSLRAMHEIVQRTALMTAMVFFIALAATVFSYVFRYFSGDTLVLELLRGLGFGDWGMLLTMLAIIFVLGFFIDWIEIALITLPIFEPVLKALDFSTYVGSPQLALVWIAALIALTLQTSFLTPPFGFALFFLKGASPPSVALRDIYRGIVPIVAIQLLGIALVLVLPGLATWLAMRAAG
ncbi:TRAP transporter large permease subunit [Reyranella aquatilis]|uniref:TRAP transporter large permease subunit n=1 Tax=Reyranella aquatilis TaxID=2035356 RepID=A0ABS8KVJ5_9HYPH|nr:TRAP transporter large permease subunit [Reyranella aquatilis]MCC8430118.1 TRAP transporter large permease subunit [Reyranella aquatilis]